VEGDTLVVSDFTGISPLELKVARSGLRFTTTSTKSVADLFKHCHQPLFGHYRESLFGRGGYHVQRTS